MTSAAFIPFLAAIFPLLIWALFRRGGYKRRPLDAPPGPDWRPTGERFVDPTSGETLDVWQSPGSGERAYLRGRPSPPGS